MERLSEKKTYKICPTCRGKGYFQTVTEAGDTGFQSAPGLAKIPGVPSRSAKSTSRPVSSRESQQKEYPSIVIGNMMVQDRSDLSSNSAAAGESVAIVNTVPKYQSPAEVAASLKMARNCMKGDCWEETMAGLEEVSRLCLEEPDSVDWDTLSLAMTRLVDGLSTQKGRVVRNCCLYLKALFRTKMTSGVHRPQFDDAVFELLKRTADTSKVIRNEADEALDVMASHVPIQYAIRAVLERAPKHKHPAVRYSAMRLIECIIETLGVDVVISHTAMREARKQILNSLCQLIDDQNQDVRWSVRRTLLSFMSHCSFDEVLDADVEPVILKRADKSLTLLLYDKKEPPVQPQPSPSIEP